MAAVDEVSSHGSSAAEKANCVTETRLNFAKFNECLIEQVRDHSNLWNPNHPEYTDFTKAANTWEEIGASLSETAQECKRYFKYLRDHYVKLVRRKFELKAEGKDCASLRPWPYFNQMAFLNSTIKFRRPNMIGLGYSGGFDFEVREDGPSNDINSSKSQVDKEGHGNKHRKRKKKAAEGTISANEVYLKLFRPPEPKSPANTPSVSAACSESSNRFLGRLVDDTLQNLHPSLKAKGRLSIKKLLCELEEKSLVLYEQETLQAPGNAVGHPPACQFQITSGNNATGSQNGHLVVENFEGSSNRYLLPVSSASLVDDKHVYAVSILETVP